MARALLPNTQLSYKTLGGIVSEARLAGLIDWNSIQDRTRSLRSSPSWEDPGHVIYAAFQSYRIDMWKKQAWRPEVWIEKDALVGVIEGVCRELSVPYFSCRGYTSQSEMWVAAQRLKAWAEGGQKPVVFHLGDHDPSGKDMTRDILDRLELFMGGVELKRLALNMDQVRKFKPPPNPAKLTDSRSEGYVAEFGMNSWELDALEPKVLSDLVKSAVEGLQNKAQWKRDLLRWKKEQELLKKASGRWEEVAEFLKE